MTEKELFEFIISQVQQVARAETRPVHNAFPQWYAQMYYSNPRDLFFSDGSGDGKVDMFFKTDDGRDVHHYIINSKFTTQYNRVAPGAFYEEVSHFCRPFIHKEERAEFLESRVKKAELRTRYKLLFERYDADAASLVFLTNFKRNHSQVVSLKHLPIKLFHFEDIAQSVVDDKDGAMPRTPPITLYEIRDVISPAQSETEVRTAIVFARLVDFIEYMEQDPHDLLFARNVRLDLGNSTINKAIRTTFRDAPKEFAYSNNGITMLCEDYRHESSSELTIDNPRVVNGSQTLHSIRSVKNPSAEARVMVRIIKIPPVLGKDIGHLREQRKSIINKISIRSNQQNPIKSWDLVANDDFNLDIFRYFRVKGFFYERRKNEWRLRSRSLRSDGLLQGPPLKKLIQLIASSKTSDKELGPWIARSAAKDLFDGSAYTKISQVPISEVYSLWLLERLISKNLPDSATYKNKLRGYIDLPLFALFCDLTRAAGLKLTSIPFDDRPQWDRKVSALVERGTKWIYEVYKSEEVKYRKAEGKPLTIANYFKNDSYRSKLFSTKLPSHLVKETRSLLS